MEPCVPTRNSCASSQFLSTLNPEKWLARTETYTMPSSDGRLIGAIVGAATFLALMTWLVWYYKRSLFVWPEWKAKREASVGVGEHLRYTVTGTTRKVSPRAADHSVATATHSPTRQQLPWDSRRLPARSSLDLSHSNESPANTCARPPYTPSQHRPDPPGSVLRPGHRPPLSLPQDYSITTIDLTPTGICYTPSHYHAEPPDSLQRVPNMNPPNLPQHYSAATFAVSPTKQNALAWSTSGSPLKPHHATRTPVACGCRGTTLSMVAASVPT